jgi:deoxyribodipyrimidine photo-lyase
VARFPIYVQKYQTKFSCTGLNQINPIQNLNEKLLSQWINGATSSDFINANMIELKQTGFMSNRGVKMWRVIL